MTHKEIEMKQKIDAVLLQIANECGADAVISDREMLISYAVRNIRSGNKRIFERYCFLMSK